MSTISETTVRQHAKSRVLWEQMVQEQINEEGSIGVLHHMGTVYREDDLQFSFTMEIEPDRGRRQQAMGMAGLLLGAHPDATSMTLHLDLALKEHEDYPELAGSDALLLVTIEIDSIGKAVLFEEASTLLHYEVKDGSLHTQELGHSESTAGLLAWVLQYVHRMAGDTRSGELVPTEEVPLQDYFQLVQAVDYINKDCGWSFLPSDRFEQEVMRVFMDEYGPDAFVVAREEFKGLELLTPRIQIVTLEELLDGERDDD